jgi:uncharacterized protein CbrC (UPF0167 family)
MTYMTRQFEFKYFPDWKRWAALTTDCNCPEGEPCLESAFFEDPEIQNPVCIGSLVSGDVRVAIPEYLVTALISSIQETFGDLPRERQNELVTQAVDQLSRTPPAQWIQSNQWPVCCGDFCRYLGEADQIVLTDKSKDGDGMSFLWSILSEECRKRRDDANHLWNEIESGWTVVYLFECLTCQKLIAVDQSY